jgi:hypothetical protein
VTPDPIAEAKVQYDRARRAHQRALLVTDEDALAHTKAYRILVRRAPSEVVVIRKSVDEAYHDNREGAWPE